MRTRVAITLALLLAHVLLGVLAGPLHSDRLAALIAGTVYVPLLPFDFIGAPVFLRQGPFFPAIAPVGWVVLAAFWSLIYFAIVSVTSALFRRPSRTS